MPGSRTPARLGDVRGAAKTAPVDPWVASTLRRLARSRFRSGFRLTATERDYLRAHGRQVIAEHAEQFITTRIAPALPTRDGRQTPWRGHPVFVAQHATATCCRGCIERWHGVPRGRALRRDEVARLVALLMVWLTVQLAGVGGVTQQR